MIELNTQQQLLIAAIALGLLQLVIAVALWRQRNAADQQRREELINEREDAERNNDIRTAAVERSLDRIELRFIGDLANTREMLERRLGETHVDQIEATAELREQMRLNLTASHRRVLEQLHADRNLATQALSELRERSAAQLATHQTRFEQRHNETQNALRGALSDGLLQIQTQVGSFLERSDAHLGKRVDLLTNSTDNRLKEISAQVESRLADGFDKTNATFTDIVKRLALIDDAQKKITDLSSNVVSLQEVLADKRSRGAFGEVQLNALVRNMLPENSFSIQHTLSNGRIVDCLLFLPTPTGNIAIDSKFPLESYQRMFTSNIASSDRLAAERSFKADIRKHIGDIAERYIVPGETAEGAVMFLPAEAVFAEIQAYHPDLVQLAHDAKVWMASPTTLMAILNTCRAVLKDEATRAQVNVIQQHLGILGKDFERFQRRMDSLSKHIKQAGRDVDDVHISARKISSRFERIEQVDLSHEESATADSSDLAMTDSEAQPPS